jgi:predicted amidohydrolase
MKAAPGDVAANLSTIARAAAEAADRGADLLIAPELATIGYGAGDALIDLAEPRDGPQLARLAAIAAENGLAVIAGFSERDGGRVFNSAAFIDGRAAPIVYRKSHLYGDYERSVFTPGDPAATTAVWRGVTIGLLICYDVEFPENVRRLAVDGADLVAVPTALPAGAEADFISAQMIPVRAFENQIFVAYANHTGRDDYFNYAGLSHIAAPDGKSLARAGAREAGLILADIHPERYAASRATNAYLADLRPMPARAAAVKSF